MTGSSIPAFDPDSPDAQILAAFERVRAARAYAYQFDGAPENAAREAELEAADKLMADDEEQVRDNVANTLPGVIAHLMLLIPSLEQDRWVDRGLMEQGLFALLREIDRLDGNAQQVAYAVSELIDIEWQRNLAAYEKSAADFALALALKGEVETEAFRVRGEGAEAGDFLTKLDDRADQIVAHFMNDDHVRRLVRTLAPDHAAFLRKVDIIIAEGFQENSAPWLARDTNYLVGRIERPELQRQEEAA